MIMIMMMMLVVMMIVMSVMSVEADSMKGLLLNCESLMYQLSIENRSEEAFLGFRLVDMPISAKRKP